MVDMLCFRKLWMDPLSMRIRMWSFRLILLACGLAIITIPVVYEEFKPISWILWVLGGVSFVFAHHLISIVQVPDKLGWLNPIADLIHGFLLWAEFVYLMFVIRRKIPGGALIVNRWETSVVVVYVSAIYVLLVLLGFWCLISLYYVVFVAPFASRGEGRQRYEGGGQVQELGIQEIPHTPDGGGAWDADLGPYEDSLGQKPTFRFRDRPRHIITSPRLWDTRFEGEGRITITLRAITAAIMVVALIMFALANIFIGPQQEISAIPAKTIYTALLTQSSAVTPGWVIIAFADQTIHSDPTLLQDALNVTALWDANLVVDGPPCQPIFDLTSNEVFLGTVAAAAVCPYQFDTDMWPELLVIFNFTKFGSNVNDSLGLAYKTTVSIVVGLTSNFSDIVDTTEPVALLPGVKLLGAITSILRRRFNGPVASVLGLFASTRDFFVAVFQSLVTDPSPQVPTGPDLATLRLFKAIDLTLWPIIADYRESTVLDGFTAFGGFSSAINALFSTIFGTTLLLVAFGSKPFSVFGIWHSFNKEKNVRSMAQKYPRLGREHDDGGLLSWMRDHMIDLGEFEGYRHQRASEVPPPETDKAA